MSRIAEMTTSALTNQGKGGQILRDKKKRKERMDTSSLMEQMLSSKNLNRAYLQAVRNKGMLRKFCISARVTGIYSEKCGLATDSY